MSSPSEIILTSSLDGPITAYDTFSGTILAHFSGTRSPPRGLVLVGKSYIAASHVSSSSPSGSIHLYNWWSSTPLHHIPLMEPVSPLAATPNGLYVFAGGLSGQIHSFSIPSGNLLKSYPAHSKPISCLVLSGDHSLLLSGGDDGTIVVVPIFLLVDALDGDEGSSNLILHNFVAHEGPVTAITPLIGSNKSEIISCSIDCTCKLWSLLNITNLRTITFPSPISGITLDPTETKFYAAGFDGLIYQVLLKVGSKRDVKQGQELVTFAEKHGGAIMSVVMVNQGKNLVSAAEDGSVRIWDIETGQLVMALGNNVESISDLVVAITGFGDTRWHGGGAWSGDHGNECGSGQPWLSSDQEPIRSIKDMADMEDVLTVASKDRCRAIDMLESAIVVYERLLQLILKEARGGNSKNNEKDKDNK